jgi:lysophospholipase L1-like esterase
MNRSWSHTKAYVDAMLEVAQEINVPVVDAWDVVWKAAGEQTEALTMFLSDGVHLTKEGYEVSDRPCYPTCSVLLTIELTLIRCAD